MTKRLVYGNFTVDCREQFPLTTLRKIDFQKVLDEFQFNIGFSGNIADLGTAKNFWSHLADKNGELGAACYNRQWRRWPAYLANSQVPNEKLSLHGEWDQFEDIRARLLKNPYDRALVIVTMNPAVYDNPCPPCHIAMVFSSDGKFLDVQVPSRSNDLIIGWPIDIARYALILHKFSNEARLTPRFIHVPHSNAHIYEFDYDTAVELIRRSPTPRPELRGNNQIGNYFPNPALRGKNF
jgi:thymidylate synthase